ncbi:unnamed protein product [Heligmosomoides polygyrus]|uniref:Protein FMC1 homolog n=1 Tax=Heligmosomoides polygyrus TaxID=6339 RepID=A0A183FSV5_HELPZ|nr:unnamed protein product [Heligmosomoides polygyrus]
MRRMLTEFLRNIRGQTLKNLIDIRSNSTSSEHELVLDPSTRIVTCHLSHFKERIHQLEKEFAAEFNKLYEQRRKIVTGEYEPTDEESKLPIIHTADEE